MDLQFRLFLLGILTLLKQIGPWWLAGLLAGSLVSVYLSERIVKLAGAFKDRRFCLLSVTLASALGIASPMCMYGTVPVIAALGRKGVPQHFLASFMISSILLNPNLFLISFLLGAPVAIARLVVCQLAGMTAGVLVWLFFRNKPLFSFDQFNLAEKQKKTLWRDVSKALRITGPYFLIGIVLTSLYTQYVPGEYLQVLFSDNKGLGVLFSVSLSVPLYVCGGGTIPLIAAWMNAGMSIGSAIAFMVAGPATKLTNLGAVKIVLGAKNFALYLAYTITMAFVSSILVDFLFGMFGRR